MTFFEEWRDEFARQRGRHEDHIRHRPFLMGSLHSTFADELSIQDDTFMAKKRDAESGDSESTPDSQTSAELMSAITDGDAERLRAALAAGASRTKLPGTKFSPLALAIRSMNPDNTTDQTVLVDTLLAVGADPNDGGSKQPTPIIRAIENQSAYPVQVRYVLEKLVQHGADLSKPSPGQSGGKTSPLESAAAMGHHDLVVWMLHKDIRTDIPEVIRCVERMLANMTKFVGDEFTESQKHCYQPIIDTLQNHANGGELPTLSEANEMLAVRQKAFVDHHMQVCQAGTQLAELMDQLAESYASELEDGSESFSAVVPEYSDVEGMPSEITMEPVDQIQWARVDRRNNAALSFESVGFQPVGCFQLSQSLHYVEAFVQPSRNLYGTIEQVDGQLFYRVIRLGKEDRFQIVTNERDMVDVEIPGFEFFWVTTTAARPIASHPVARGDLDSGPGHPVSEDDVIPATAERFTEHYCLGYRLFRERLLQVLSESGPPTDEPSSD